MAGSVTAGPSAAVRRMLVPLALAQFICSFAGSNMNVMINDISKDLNTTVRGGHRASISGKDEHHDNLPSTHARIDAALWIGQAGWTLRAVVCRNRPVGVRSR